MATEFGSIRQIHDRLIAEGFNVSEYALRRWIKDGKIRAVYSGSKAYLRYDAVLAVLNGEKIEQPA